MKHIPLISSVCATLLLSTAISFAGNLTLGLADPAVQQPVQQSKWYVSGFGGISNLNDVSTFTRLIIPGGRPGSPPRIIDIPYSVAFDSGYTFGATIGRHVFQDFRLEAELSYSKYDANTLDTTTRGAGPASGDLTATYLLANIWYDIPLESKISPYIGGGLGAARVNAKVQFAGTSGYKDGDTNFAYQLGLGFTYPVGNKLNLDIGYRYKAVPSLDFGDRTSPTVIYKDGTLSSHNLQVGLLYDF